MVCVKGIWLNPNSNTIEWKKVKRGAGGYKTGQFIKHVLRTRDFGERCMEGLFFLFILYLHVFRSSRTEYKMQLQRWYPLFVT